MPDRSRPTGISARAARVSSPASASSSIRRESRSGSMAPAGGRARLGRPGRARDAPRRSAREAPRRRAVPTRGARAGDRGPLRPHVRAQPGRRVGARPRSRDGATHDRLPGAPGRDHLARDLLRMGPSCQGSAAPRGHRARHRRSHRQPRRSPAPRATRGHRLPARALPRALLACVLHRGLGDLRRCRGAPDRGAPRGRGRPDMIEAGLVPASVGRLTIAGAVHAGAILASVAIGADLARRRGLLPRLIVETHAIAVPIAILLARSRAFIDAFPAVLHEPARLMALATAPPSPLPALAGVGILLLMMAWASGRPRSLADCMAPGAVLIACALLLDLAQPFGAIHAV